MSLSSHQLLILLLQVCALLFVALCLGRLAMRFGMPTVVGELMTGVLLGPSVLGHVTPAVSGWLWPADLDQRQLLDAVSQLGVLLFVGISGAHLDIRLVRRRGRTVAAVGGIALALPIGLGITAGHLLPDALLGPSANRTTFSLLLGVVMGVSALPVIAKTLTDLRMLHRDVGQLTLASAAMDDVVAWLLLSVVSVMVTTGFDGGRLAIGLASLAGFLLAVALIARPVAKVGLRVAARSDGPGPSIIVAIVLILGGAAASQALGLEAVLGAFVIGIVVGSPRVADVARLVPLRTVTLAVFAPIFLAGAGLRMDLSVLRDPRILAVAVVVCVVAIAGKFAGAYLGARLGRLGHWEGLALGAGLNARGAVEVVVATIGLRIGVLSPAMYTIVVLVAVLTSVMTPPVLRWAMSRVEQRADERLRRSDQAAWSDVDEREVVE